MKIAIFSELFFPYVQGGGERRFYEIAKRLAKKHEVHVYTMNLEGVVSEEIIEGIKIHRIGKSHPIDKRSNAPMISYFYHAVRTGTKEKFDIIDCNTYISAIAGGIVAKRTNTPCLVHVHDVYSPNWHIFLNSRILGLAGELLERIVLKMKFNKFIVVSSSTKKLVEPFGVKNIVVVTNGVDDHLFYPSDAERQKKIIYVGRLVASKNVFDLLDAFRVVINTHPEYILEIVGNGELRPELEQIAEHLGIADKVTFTGSVKLNSIVADKIRESRMLVNPSIREGFGLVMLEGMACGTPVVGYDLDAYKDFADENNSILAKDLKGLIEGIISLIENNEKWMKLSENGKITALKFSWDEITDKLEQVYIETIKEKK